MRVVQGQQSFIKGQITPSAIARLGNDYFSSCRSVKDLIIQKDGSAVCRGGFEKIESIPPGIFADVDDIAVLKYKDKLLFFYLSEGNVYFKFENGEVRSLYFSTGNIESHKIDGSETGQYSLGYDEKIKQSFTAFNTGNAIKIKKILDRVFVFYENCFPFKIWIQGDIILTAPFFQGGEDEIYNAFPFSRTLGEEVNLQKVISNRNRGPFPDNLKLKLKIENVVWEGNRGPNGECEASFTYDDISENDEALEPDVLSLKALKGHPICFSMGTRKGELDNIKRIGDWPSYIKRSYDFLLGRDLVYDDFVSQSAGNQTNVLATVERGNNRYGSSGDLDIPLSSNFNGATPIGKIGNDVLVILGSVEPYFYSATDTRYNRVDTRDDYHLALFLSRPDFSDHQRNNYVRYEESRVRDFRNGSIVLVRYDNTVKSWRILYSSSSPRRYVIDPVEEFESGASFKTFKLGEDIYFWNERSPNSPQSNTEIKVFKKVINSRRTWGFEFTRTSFRTLTGQFDEFFITATHFYTVLGNVVRRYLRSSGEEQKPFVFSSDINGFDATSNKFIRYSSSSLQESQALNALIEFTGNLEANPTPILTGINAERRVLDYTRRYFSALGYRFFILFPYEETEDKRKMKCKFFTLGFDYSKVSLTRGLGGSDLEGREDETDNFVISDWYDGWPINGDSISGKDFFITSGSKLSYSSIRRRGLFGSPIKVLFNSSGFNYNVNRSKLATIFRRDFLRISPPLQRFFDRIDDEEDTVLFTLGDPFTYVFRDTDGDKVKILNFIKSDIGAFTAAGAQSIALTNKGVFFWGINAQATNTNSFVALGKVSNFKGSEKFKAMVEVLNRVYVTDEFGDLYVVEFNETNRNFASKPCSADVDLKNMLSGVSFPGNRVLGIREDNEERKLYLAVSEMRGILTGLSEFTIREQDILYVFKFEERIFVLTNKEGTLSILEYKKDKKYDLDYSGGFSGILETVPITVGRSHPFHSFLNQVLDISKIAVWSDGRTIFDFRIPPNGKFNSVQILDREGRIVPPNGEFITFIDTINKITKGRGIQLRLNSIKGGCLCGLTIYADAKQLQ